ncbi:hypothetical protein [Streptomyces sp. NPDC056169]|uniref:hypothetical protein n=1 Tax=Streptomyces sp. NPDC056169 TaxID=3345734 RepID=UPI0035D93939
MTSEHPRPTSRITDALLPTPPAPPAPPGPKAPTTTGTPAPTPPATTRRPASPEPPERPTASRAPAPAPQVAPRRPASPETPAASRAPAPAPLAAPQRPAPPASPASPVAPERPTASRAPAPASLPAPAVQGGSERPTATGRPQPMPRPATAAAPKAPTATGTPAPAYPPTPPRPAAPTPPKPTAAPPRPRTGAGSASAPLSPRQAPAPARDWAAPHGAGDLPEVETTTRLRPIRDTARSPHLSRPAYGNGLAGALPPEAPVETTTRLRPVRERRTGRVLAVTACVVLGVGLIGGALAGIWLASTDPAGPAEPAGYTDAKDLWHNAPVDTLFPRTLAGPGAGPGAADRTWTRIVVAPDTRCSPAVLAKGLLATLTPLGCERVLRATYTDATASSVVTVGLVFTRADADAQRTLGQGGLTARLGEDVPPALSGPSTVAARFGARQRASWWLSAPADLPVVVTAVSGFADGRAVDRPQPADRAMTRGRTDATAQSGLGHEAKGITGRFEALLRKTVAAAVKEKENAR